MNSKLKFTNRAPTDWKDLQNLVAEYLNIAGYKAITPYEIETVRGSIEIDVYIQSPYDLVKRIVCECKYWNTRVTKEKEHAFRTVVADCGAELGIIISKSGYQSGAIQAAQFSNVRLETWDTFLELIKDRWINNKLWSIKTMSAKILNYSDTYEYEAERLTKGEFLRYKTTCENIADAVELGLFIRKSDLINDTPIIRRFPLCKQSESIEYYLNELSPKLNNAQDILESLSVKPNNPERYLSIIKLYME